MLDPVIGLRFVELLRSRLKLRLRLLLRLGLELRLRLGDEAREPPPRASRASSSGAMNAKPRRTVRKVGRSFMIVGGGGSIGGGIGSLADDPKVVVRLHATINDPIGGGPDEGVAAFSSELLT